MIAVLRSERFAGEGPAEGLSHGLVEVGDECLDTLLEFGGGFETAPAQELAGQDGEPDLDLVEPGSMFRGEVDNDAVSAIAQERFPCGFALEMSGLSFLAKVFVDATQPDHKADHPSDTWVLRLSQPAGVRVTGLTLRGGVRN